MARGDDVWGRSCHEGEAINARTGGLGNGHQFAKRESEKD